MQATRLDVQAALAEGGTRSVAGGAKGWPRRLLVVAEVALGVVLLVGAGLLTRTFMHLQSQPPGFDPRQIRVAVGVARRRALRKARERAAAVRAQPRARLRDDSRRGVGGGLARPARTSASSTWARASSVRRRAERLRLHDRDLRDTRLLRNAAPAGAARPHAAGDSDTTTGAKVVVVNESFATRYFKDRDRGRRIREHERRRSADRRRGRQRAAARRLQRLRAARCAAGDLHAVLAVPARWPADDSWLVLARVDHPRGEGRRGDRAGDSPRDGGDRFATAARPRSAASTRCRARRCRVSAS